MRVPGGGLARCLFPESRQCIAKNNLSVQQNPLELRGMNRLAVRENLRSVPEKRDLGEPIGSGPDSVSAAPGCVGGCVCVCFSFCWHIFKFLNTLAVPGHHISKTCPVAWRFRFILYLKHGPSFGDSRSSYILNMPLDLASAVPPPH